MSIAANNPEVTISTMTMPHLMNCPHSEDWCLSCVKEMHDEYERLLDELRSDYADAMTICYAASEFSAGRISAHELIQTVKQGDDDEAGQ